MAWPLSQDYNEALQNPLTSFSDAELRQGQVVTNALGIPQPCSGNFADVYAVECAASKTKWAVKCFTRQVSGLSERYSEISKYLRLAKLPFTVDFQYLEQGIRVRGQWYPILKMQWVEGFVLNAFVRDNLDKKPILQALGQIWLRMARRLRESYIAHCDLQHGNVMFVPGSSAHSLAVKLIDYDGMCVPSLIGTKSGEVGHPAYQHPERLRTGAYNQEVDRFSLLLIATSLRCLALGGRSLWQRYDNGDNLLFRQSDLQAPADSPLFRELLTIDDAQARMLVQELYRACQGPFDDVPLLTDLLSEEKPAGKVKATVAKQPAAAQGSNWDFPERETGKSVAAKKQPASSKMPGWVWGVIAGVPALLLLGGVLIWAMSSKSQPDKATPDQQQARAKPKEAVIPLKDQKSPRLTEKSKPDDPPTPPPEKPKSQNPTPTPKPKPKPEDAPPPKPTNVKVPIPDGPPGEVRRFEGHTAELNGAAFSPDGRHALSGSNDGTVRLWDLTTGKEVRQLTGHQDKVQSVVFSPDGKRALTGSLDKTARVWNVEKGEELLSFRGHNDWVRSVAFSPNGNRALTASGGPGNIDCTVRLWDVANGEIIRTLNGHDKPVTSAVFTPDGRRAVSGSDDMTVRLWDLADGREVRKYTGHKEGVYCVAVSGDGRVAASAAFDKTIRLWDLESDKELRRLDGHTDLVMSVAFTPDGRRLLSGSLDKTLRLWDRASGQELARFEGDQASVRCVAVSPDGRFALSGGSDKLVRLWRLPPPVEMKPDEPPVEKVREIAFLSSFSVLSKKHALDWFATNGTVGAGGKFTVQGKESPHGIFLHPEDNRDAEVSYKLGRKWAMFRCGVAVPRMGDKAEEKGIGSPLTFEVHGDEVSLWTSKPVRDFGKPRWCEVNVEKVDVLRLRVHCPGSASCARAVWLEPRVMTHSDPQDPSKTAEGIAARLPVPDEATQKKATEDIRDIYKSDYLSRQPDDLVLLARKLFKRGLDNTEEPARRFVSFREGRDLAARGGDLAFSFRVIDEMCGIFSVEQLPMKTIALERAAASIRSLEAGKTVAGLTLDALEDAEEADDYDQALKLIGIAQKAAPKAGDPFLSAVLTQRRGRAERLQKAYVKNVDAALTLATKPRDPEANLSMGKFHCFDKEDWDKGLPMLARGADTSLADLARKDLAKPADAAGQLALGQAWGGVAEKEKEGRIKAMQQRAKHWLYGALPSLNGADKDRVESRLERKVGTLKLRPGLVAELFAGENFEKRVKTRIDYKAYYDWGDKAPDAGVPADHFSIRWHGWLVPPRAGKYKLALWADDGARLFVDGKNVIDFWGTPGPRSTLLLLSAKPHEITLEYHESIGLASVHLAWTLEDGFKEQTIPLEALYHDSKQERLLAP